MRAVLVSVFVLSAILFTTLVLYFTLHGSPSESGIKLKLNMSCKHENYTGICKSQDPCASNIRTIRLKPCNEGDLSLVCCPNTTDENVGDIRPKRTPGERAEEMCKIYGKDGHREIPSPAWVGPKSFTEPNCEIQEPLIKGGEDAKKNEFPHMVQIGNFLPDDAQVLWVCGGSLVSPEFILSAAHCSVTKEYGYAMFGTNKVENTKEFFEKHVISISEVYIHPNYNPKNSDNDLALYKLSSKLNKTERPICLDTSSSLTKNMTVVATGFGLNKDLLSEELSEVLQKVGLNIVDQGSCEKKYKPIPRDLPEFAICAYAEGKDTCKADSGGPIQTSHSKLQCMFTLVGVTSFGINCSLDTNLPGVYTKISPYLGWIEDIVWPA